jgi:hypothetical protein
LTDPSKAALVGLSAEVLGLFGVGFDGPEPPVEPEPPAGDGPVAAGTPTPALVAGLDEPLLLLAVTVQVSVCPWSAEFTV